MKFLCALKNDLPIIRNCSGLSFATEGLGYLVGPIATTATCHLLQLSLLARYKLSCYQTTPLLTISALADITLLKSTCHFLLLLVGFDTLTYRKQLQLNPYTCGSSSPQHSTLFHIFGYGGKMIWVESNLGKARDQDSCGWIGMSWSQHMSRWFSLRKWVLEV